MIYDSAIIGTGPAGLAAALVLKIHNKNIIWFGSKLLSEKLRKAEQILNYPGLPAVSGEEMCAAFTEQIGQMGLEINESMVTTMMHAGDSYAIMAGNDFYEAKTVILATGVVASGTIPGEERLLGAGVSYCATCDGALYKGKKIAVICNNARFEQEVEFLAELADTVYYFPTYKKTRVGSGGVQDTQRKDGAAVTGDTQRKDGVAVTGEVQDKSSAEMPDNVQRMDSRVISVNGDTRVQSVTLKDKSELPVDGVFCLRDSISPATLLKGLQIEDGHIHTDRNMAANMPGCFAAGDCTGRPYQYVKAAGEGNVAAHSVLEYLKK